MLVSHNYTNYMMPKLHNSTCFEAAAGDSEETASSRQLHQAVHQ